MSLSTLSADELRAGLGDCAMARRIVVLDRTSSTNDVVARMLSEGCAEGLVVFAEQQMAGRGQRGNAWESAQGRGLWFSILLRPKIPVAESPRLTTWAANTIAQTIEDQLDVVASVKPPNDVHIGDRKVAGVLVEMRAEPRAPHAAIMGIGVNVNHRPEDFSEELRPRATSLAVATGHAIDRGAFAIALLRKLDVSYAERFAP